MGLLNCFLIVRVHYLKFNLLSPTLLYFYLFGLTFKAIVLTPKMFRTLPILLWYIRLNRAGNVPEC